MVRFVLWKKKKFIFILGIGMEKKVKFQIENVVVLLMHGVFFVVFADNTDFFETNSFLGPSVYRLLEEPEIFIKCYI